MKIQTKNIHTIIHREGPEIKTLIIITTFTKNNHLKHYIT